MPYAPNLVFPRAALGEGAVSLPFTRSPMWQTRGPTSVAGVETLQADWSYPRYKYKFSVAYLRAAAAFGELSTLIGFYNQVAGRWGVWQYDDPSDDVAGPAQVIGFGDGATKTFQLVRSYGGFVEPVFAVNVNTELRANGALLVENVDYSIGVTGVITFPNAPLPGVVLTWTGTFLWFVRFDTDQQEFNMLVGALTADPYGPLWSSSLTFTTIKMGA